MLSEDPTRPLLHPTIIIKLSKAISKVSRPTKRTRLAPAHWEGADSRSPRKAGGMSEVDAQTLARLLKLLERSIRAGEDLDPFETLTSASSWRKSNSDEGGSLATKAAKPSLAGKETHVAEPMDGRAEAHKSEHGESSGLGRADDAEDLTDERVCKLERQLEVARDSVLAADCCISLLTSDRLAKQVRC